MSTDYDDEGKQKLLQSMEVDFGCAIDFILIKKKKVIKLDPKHFNSITYFSTSEFDGIKITVGQDNFFCREELGIALGEGIANFRYNYDLDIAEDDVPDIILSPMVEIDREKADKRKPINLVVKNLYSQLNRKVILRKNTTKVNIYPLTGSIYISCYFPSCDWRKPDIKKECELIKTLDYVLGNTCVLIDRNRLNVDRRKIIGKAGDYILVNKQQIRYLVLSPFWFQSYPLMSFITAMTRLSYEIVAAGKENIIFDAVASKDIMNAINNNDYRLALKNFKKIMEILLDLIPKKDDSFPLDKSTIDLFYHFVKMIHKEGLKYWFKEKVFSQWENFRYGIHGWERFLENKVFHDFMKFKKGLSK